MESFDASKGLPHPSRTANNTKLYAGAAREVATELEIPVADLWTAFMEKTDWKEGQWLPGSRDVPNDERLARLLTDGSFLPVLLPLGLEIGIGMLMTCRAAFDLRRI